MHISFISKLIDKNIINTIEFSKVNKSMDTLNIRNSNSSKHQVLAHLSNKSLNENELDDFFKRLRDQK